MDEIKRNGSVAKEEWKPACIRAGIQLANKIAAG